MQPTTSDRYIEKHGEARRLLAEIEAKLMALPVPEPGRGRSRCK